MLQINETFLAQYKDRLFSSFNTIVADALATQEAGHQEPWYQPSYSCIFRFGTTIVKALHQTACRINKT